MQLKFLLQEVRPDMNAFQSPDSQSTSLSEVLYFGALGDLHFCAVEQWHAFKIVLRIITPYNTLSRIYMGWIMRAMSELPVSQGM
jgi:hypothetical protein